jgi:hypothetical protein
LSGAVAWLGLWNSHTAPCIPGTTEKMLYEHVIFLRDNFISRFVLLLQYDFCLLSLKKQQYKLTKSK